MAGEVQQILHILENDADPRTGAIHLTIVDIARLAKTTDKKVTRICWAFQKLGFLTFTERHLKGGTELIHLRLRRVKKLQITRSEVIFETSFELAAPASPGIQVRKEKMREAADLLEEAGEDDLALMVLEAIDGKYPVALLDPAAHKVLSPDLPGEGRIIRRLTPEEYEALWVDE